MGIPVEHERKFLVLGDAWRGQAIPSSIRQGYIARDAAMSVRIRRRGAQAFLTLKSKGVSASKVEFEYPIPTDHAEYLLTQVCDRQPIEKVRYELYHAGRLWEIDEFLGHNRGLVLAEVELASLDEDVLLPPWAGREVTGDPRYCNSHLYHHPFTSWHDREPPIWSAQPISG